MAHHRGRCRRGHLALEGIALLALTALILTTPLESPCQERPERDVIGIAPLESDLEAMRATLRSIETLINDGTPQEIESLISPRVSEPQRRGIILITESFVSSLSPESSFEMRTDLGRGAIVPIGAERIQVQVSSTQVSGETRQTGRVDIQLEAVEAQHQRRWLLVEVSYPGHRPILTGGFPTELLIAIIAVVIIPIALFVTLTIRRRRARRVESI